VDEPSESPARLLRRGLLGLAVLTTAGIAVELAVERHWTQPIQLVAWAAVALAAVATALLFGSPSGGRVRLARILAAVVLVSAVLGIWEHVEANYDVAPLDYRYADSWDSMIEPARWWLAISKTVGPSPPLAPGALVQAALCIVLATLRHPALARGGAGFPHGGRSTA
jgi:hypothetical protein